MAILRTDIERALDELNSQEGGMRFQRLAVVLGRQRWPELTAHPPKGDFGLDAYADASETPEKIGNGLAASITATLKKASDDAKKAKKNFPDLRGKTRGSFPNDEAATKLIYLAVGNAGQIAKANTYGWKTALNQFAILFGDRLSADQI